MTMNALQAHELMTFVVGSICFLIAVVVMHRARHDDAPHPRPIPAEPEVVAIVCTRRVIFGTFVAMGIAWPTSAYAAALHYCSGPLSWLMIECWF
jgi:hypothetical protein